MAVDIYKDLSRSYRTGTGDTGLRRTPWRNGCAPLVSMRRTCSIQPAPRKGNHGGPPAALARAGHPAARHLDVVEAKPEDWSVDPFKLIEKDAISTGAARRRQFLLPPCGKPDPLYRGWL